jgi:hypothetical protein
MCDRLPEPLLVLATPAWWMAGRAHPSAHGPDDLLTSGRRHRNSSLLRCCDDRLNSPTPAPTLPAGVLPCTGSSTIKQWLANQVSKLKFTLYCAVLPAGWSVVNMTYDYGAGGLQAHYKNGAGYKIDVWEGNVCGIQPNPCTGFWAPDLGSQAFGPLTGDMAGSGGMWTVVVDTSNPKVMYTITGEGMTAAAFRTYSAAMHKIS